ncbi:GGDEF domain-containing response regulator [Bacillus benzoevorans]|uniref:Diguanylate cyclase (GGDEF)-like protein n=1 Tax=Bacillus benzoevorans TaxID=1456 RepID=A0A7X0HQY3_9BACI|nr:response regulator [Bacillus benzoevorans]MBB6444005.1 diguanylate cyclase (GGDEF)-like protein [Bacillus benzoevorans]
MEKYQQHLLKNIRSQLNIWMEEKEHISHDDVYRFLHSIAGTAGTIGMSEMSSIAKDLMGQMKTLEVKDWTIKEIQDFILTLLSHCYEYSNNSVECNAAEQHVKDGQPFILVVDDETSMLMFLKEELEKYGWIVMVVSDPVKAISAFYDMRPDCVIIDIHMQKKDGFELLAFLKEKLKQWLIPTVMISIDNSKSNRMKTFELGADDFIAKPFEIDELYVRVKRHIERKKLIDNLILTDELTRVYNRKYTGFAYDTMCSSIGRRDESFCLAVLDLDHFKIVNDSYGHLTGDIVLKEFAAMLSNQCRSGDIVIRYGGEEFLLFMERVSAPQGKEILDRLLQDFQSHSFSIGEDSFTCTFSAGIVEVNRANDSLNYWIKLADDALYKAKSLGRKQIQISESNKKIIHKKPLRIAIIDDDPIIRTILEDSFSRMTNELKFALNVKTFRGGAEFLGAQWSYSNENYMVVLDGIMPEMDGLEVLQSLRATTRQNQYKVMMLTSRNSEKDIARALELGADDYVTKPFKMTELEARISYLCKRMK